MASKTCSPCCSPLFLRLALGVVFVWAGAIKVMDTVPVKGEDAAALANMGVISPTAAATSPAAPTAPPAIPAAPKDSKPAPDAGSKGHAERPIPTEPTPIASKPGLSGLPALAQVKTVPRSPTGGKAYTADDFPDEVKVRAVNGLALMLKKAAATTDADGKPLMALWPEFLGKDHWPVYMAWLCAITELVGGVFVLIGFLTRLSAFGLASVMGVAMWLSQIGPAMQSGSTILGFLPKHPWNDGMGWHLLQFQLVLMLCAFALMGLGSGSLGLDRVLFPPPTPPAPKPKPENAPVQ